MTKIQTKNKKKKAHIPKALREQVWISHAGKNFTIKCFTPWCQNPINAFDFHCGHMIAEALGGSTTIDNLIPLCARCNLSMSTTSFKDWSKHSIITNKPISIVDNILVGPSSYVSSPIEHLTPVKMSSTHCCTIM